MASLTVLAEEVLAHAKLLDSALQHNNIPQPTREKDTLDSLPDSDQHLKRDLIDSSHALLRLAIGPQLWGWAISYNWTEAVILRLVWRYRLPFAVPKQGSATYAQISAECGLSEPAVTRVIRAAITLGIFDEQEVGQVCHSAISRLMAEDEGYYSALGLQLEDLGPASLKLMEAWETYGSESGEPDKSAFSLANGGRSLFTVLSEEPERAQRFDAAMKYDMQQKGLELSKIVPAYDWHAMDKPGSRIVDLGGGYGQVAQYLAQHTQHIVFTVQDLPHVVEEGKSQLPIELSTRVSFEAHDFMDPQAVKTLPNAYLISRCLHNWSDSHSSKILRALIPALRKGSKVLIWDSVLPERPVSKYSERYNLQQDFIMATIFNGKDRSTSEFRALLAKTDPRFVLEQVRQPAGSKLSLLEVTWIG